MKGGSSSVKTQWCCQAKRRHRRRHSWSVWCTQFCLMVDRFPSGCAKKTLHDFSRSSRHNVALGGNFVLAQASVINVGKSSALEGPFALFAVGWVELVE
eukprot:6928042-Lingulodinium_polyedra.AAC.1